VYPCEVCNKLHPSEEVKDLCCSERMHYFHKPYSLDITHGTDFTRFSNRPVGIEIETGSGGRKLRVYRWVIKNFPLWGASEDTSIAEDAYEFQTNPTTGNLIADNYAYFHQILLDFGVKLEAKDNAFQVQVYAGDLFDLVDKLHKTNPIKALEIEKCIKIWGECISSFLLETRRLNISSTYPQCSLAYRSRASKGGTLAFTTMPTVLEPAIAIRKATFEFRTLPSVNDPSWHIARTELAQKSVDYLFTRASAGDYESLSTLSKITQSDWITKVSNLASIIALSNASKLSWYIHHVPQNH